MAWSAAVIGVARDLNPFESSVGVRVTFELSNSVTKEVLTITVALPNAGFIAAAGARLVQDLAAVDDATDAYALASPQTPMVLV